MTVLQFIYYSKPKTEFQLQDGGLAHLVENIQDEFLYVIDFYLPYCVLFTFLY